MDFYKDDLLMHYGTIGMKWGVRKYQNADGTLTAAGKKRYGADNISDLEKKSQAEGRSEARAAKKQLKKINKERNYIDSQFAIRKLYDAAKYDQSRIAKNGTITDKKNDFDATSFNSMDLGYAMSHRPFTLSPIRNSKNKRAAWTGFANTSVGNLTSPTGRTITWVEKEHFMNPIGVYKEKRSRSGHWRDRSLAILNITGTKPIFEENKKKG